MKKHAQNGSRGFTLIELLMVLAMLGIVMGAMYSLYISHQRTAYTSDETVEVQQNLRIAMDSMSRDIRIAGLLLAPGSTPISAGSTSTSIYLSSGCPSAIVTRITPSSSPRIGTASPNTFPVDVDGSASAFSNNDYVRILHPLDKTQPGGTNRIYKVAGTPGTSITLNIVTGYTDPTGVEFRTGDVICKVSSATAFAPPNTIQYYIGNSGTCPAGQQCLMRIDESGTTNVIAQNMALNGLQLQYLLDGYPLPNEVNAPTTTMLSKIRAVRVTVTGQTAATVTLSGNMPKTRKMETIIQLRNR
ncbi:MAG TPA: prepilin-type N-terminal cleavage/methylation domain-containing protein [Nitrospirota bacterium]|nr:prepilin-type N-terminal cleavage/methylation domain-containing protein [Nitrospirota bacterium]